MPTALQLQRGGGGVLLAALLAALAAACRAQPIAIEVSTGSATPRLDVMKQQALSILATMEGEFEQPRRWLRWAGNTSAVL